MFYLRCDRCDRCDAKKRFLRRRFLEEVLKKASHLVTPVTPKVRFNQSNFAFNPKSFKTSLCFFFPNLNDLSYLELVMR